MTDTTPLLDLPYILAAQAQKEVTHNEALNRLDAALHCAVLDRDLTAPPAGPADGDRYLVAAGATGAWAGQDGRLAAWYDGWTFLVPRAGWEVWVADEGVRLRHDGTAWAVAGHQALPDLQGGAAGERYHLTAAQHADLTDGGDATVHRHANATGGADGFLAAADKAKLDGIAPGAQVNAVTTVQGRTGAVTLVADDLGLGSDDVATFAGLALSAVGRKLASSGAPVAVLLYDTARDSDGGAWVDRCQHLSWYNETLGTATRGGTRAFPRLAVIVAAADKLTIYDATDPALPMWMAFSAGGTANCWLATGSAARPITALAARDGKLVVGRGGESSGAGMGVAVLDFPADGFDGRRLNSTAALSGMVNRNAVAPVWITGTAGTLVDGRVSAVAVTVLPFTPTDPVMGLPLPTIGVGTGGGVSVMLAGGRVTDSAATGAVKSVAFLARGEIAIGLVADNSLRVAGPAGYMAGDSWPTPEQYDAASIPAMWSASNGVVTAKANGEAAIAYADGAIPMLVQMRRDSVMFARGMVAYATKDYATGWLPGDVRLALAEKDITGLAAGSVVLDRCIKANHGTVVGGTINRAAVATGADLSYYSGFSTSAYLEWPWDGDFDFGGGDFCVLLWDQKSSVPAGSQVLMARGSPDNTGAYWEVLTLSTGEAWFAISDGTNTATATTAGFTGFTATGVWQQIAAVKRGGRLELWVNGKMLGSASAAAVGSLNNPGAVLRLGQRVRNSNNGGVTRIALPRVTACAPGPEQIARLYADEAALFRTGAKCLLGGTANSVDALAYDADTDRLLAAGPDGTAIFKGLRRVAYVDAAADPNLTTDDHNAVAAARGGHVIGSAAEAVASLPGLTFRGEHGRARDRKGMPDVMYGRTVDATPTDIGKLPVEEGQTVVVEALVEAREHRDAPSERAAYVRRGVFYREIGGNVTLAGSVATTDLYESSAGMDCTLEADATAQTIDVNVTGVAGKTLGWAARLTVTRLPEREMPS